ncbi:MAG: GDP-mannose 4,6-dehydratase [Chloroflexi bacterium]|nr:GDP-mannose 4,6-dehydratase [Chloroflexota bacterium]
MRILVTGVAGFIGSNLTEGLLARGHSVVGIDNLSQGTRLNMESFRGHPAFAFHEVDIRDEQAVTTLAEGCDVIVHLAAFKIPRYSDAYDTLTINAYGSENLLKAAVAHKAKIVAASTSDVYGKNPDIPFSEEHNSVIGAPTVKRWAYAISKMFEEQMAFAYHERHGIDVVLLRFFGGYGPNQHLTWWGGPQSVFINMALDNEELPIHGDGQQTRTFTYIKDHVDGIIRTIEMPEANNHVFNLGGLQEVTIESLARTVWRLVRGEDAPAKIKFIPYAQFGKYEDVMRRVPDITKARTLLGFDPKTDLETGLRETIAWQIERRKRLAGADS